MNREDFILMTVGGLTLDPVTKTPDRHPARSRQQAEPADLDRPARGDVHGHGARGHQDGAPDDARSAALDPRGARRGRRVGRGHRAAGEHLLRADLPARRRSAAARSTRARPTPSAWRCARRARSTSRRRCSRPRASCSRWRRARSRTSPTCRATSGPRSSRRCRPTTSSTRCSAWRRQRNASSSTARRYASPTSSRHSPAQAAAWAQANTTMLVGIAAAVRRRRVRSSAASAGIARGAPTPPRSQFQTADVQFQGGHYAEAADAFDDPRSRLRRDPVREAGVALRRPRARAEAGSDRGRRRIRPPTWRAHRRPSTCARKRCQGLAQAREAGGDAKGAQEAYEQAAAIDGPFQTDARVAVARLYEAAGQSDKAREVYTRDPEGLADRARSGRCWKRRSRQTSPRRVPGRTRLVVAGAARARHGSRRGFTALGANV